MKSIDLIETLKTKNTLTDKQYTTLKNIYAKKLIPLYWELRILLYAGVLFLAAGIGLTIKKYYAQLSHTAIIGFLTLAFLSAFTYCFKKRKPYMPEKVKSPTIAFDYILLLACLLYSLNVAYIETHFHILDIFWKNYLLISAGLFIYIAYFFDNRLILSLGLSTLYAWFGLKMSDLTIGYSEIYRLTGISYGICVLLIGIMFNQRNIKKHFFNIYLNFAALFVFIPCISGVFQYKLLSWYFAGLIIACTAAALYSLRTKKFLYMLYAVIFCYLGLSIAVLDLIKDTVTLIFWYLIISSIGIVWFIWHVSQDFKEKQ